MAKEYDLILVGGTGQRFGVMLGWLNLLGLAEPPRKVLVLDAEGMAHPTDVSNRLRLLFDFARDKPTDFQAAAPHGGDTDATPRTELNSSGDLYRLCMTEAEDNLKIEQGFMGNPKVAATVFTNHAVIAGEDIIKSFIPPQNARVPLLIVGSVAGGTGAGLINSIAKACRQHLPVGNVNAPILGMVFTNYLDLNDAALTARLDRNSRFGSDFLYKEWSLKDGRFPFDLCVLLGPPEKARTTEAHLSVHPFPGFLLGASLVADGCETLRQTAQQNAVGTGKQGQQAQAGLHLVAVRDEQGGQSYIRGTDLHFRCEDRSLRISADDFKQLLTLYEEILDEFQSFSWESAVGIDSMFPRNKLTPVIWDTVVSLGGTRKAQIPRIRKLFDMIRASKTGAVAWSREQLLANTAAGPAGGSAADSTISFRSWFEQACKNGLQASDHTESPNVKRRSWRAALLPQPHAVGAKRDANEFLAQAWTRDIATGLMRDDRTGSVPSGNLQYALPFPLPPPAAPGLVAMSSLQTQQVALDCLSGMDLEGAESGSCFPTPLGRAHYFTRMLEGDLLRLQDRSPCWDEARALWLGMALGWLELDIVDLKQGNAFERTMAFLEKTPFIGVLRTARPFTGIPKGTPVGGTEQACGLWSGVTHRPEDNSVRDAIRAINTELAANPQEAQKAMEVLALWLADVRAIPGYVSNPNKQPTWLRFVGAIAGKATPCSEKDIATEGPVQFVLPDVKPAPLLYLYRLDKFRMVRRRTLLEGLGGQNSALQLYPEPSKTTMHTGDFDIQVRNQGGLQSKVGTIRGRLVYCQGGVDLVASLARGALHLRLDRTLQMDGNGSGNRDLPEGVLQNLAHQVRQDANACRVRTPDILWPVD